MGSFVGGFMFDRLGSITSYAIVSGVAFSICIVQMIVNQLINRYSKDTNLKKNRTVGGNAVGDVNDNL